MRSSLVRLHCDPGVTRVEVGGLRREAFQRGGLAVLGLRRVTDRGVDAGERPAGLVGGGAGALYGGVGGGVDLFRRRERRGEGGAGRCRTVGRGRRVWPSRLSRSSFNAAASARSHPGWERRWSSRRSPPVRAIVVRGEFRAHRRLPHRGIVASRRSGAIRIIGVGERTAGGAPRSASIVRPAAIACACAAAVSAVVAVAT
ncbi:hypothetical protein [Sphingomonas sp.]|uniref:hypothetical protein n=1 Tax=Sphingomonas sp. TaxID=28214 RepID=UPI003B0091EC